MVEGPLAAFPPQHRVLSPIAAERPALPLEFRDEIAAKGMVFSGFCRDPRVNAKGGLVEMIELREHPYFVGCQFHPEFKSKPLSPHPLFRSFVAASLQAAKGNR